MTPVVFTNAKIFDGTGRDLFPGEVRVEGKHIAAVAEGTEQLSREGANVINCEGATLMPGLVESHGHLSWPSSVGRVFTGMMLPPEEHLLVTAHNARVTLEAGFTSVYSAGSLGGVVTNDMIANIAVNANIGINYNFGEQCMPIKCDTVCMRSARDWSFRVNRLPNGTLIIIGFNFNNPVSIQRNAQTIQTLLTLGGTPMQDLNREFIALQLSLASAGGTSSPVVFNTYWSPLRCSGVNFAPFTLTNGYPFTPETLLNDLMLQVQGAIRENRTADFQALANLVALLNGRC